MLSEYKWAVSGIANVDTEKINKQDKYVSELLDQLEIHNLVNNEGIPLETGNKV